MEALQRTTVLLLEDGFKVTYLNIYLQPFAAPSVMASTQSC